MNQLKPWHLILVGVLLIAIVAMIGLIRQGNMRRAAEQGGTTKNLQEKGEDRMRLGDQLPENPNLSVDYSQVDLAEIWLAGGCFWGVEAYMARIPGVADVTSGYANGTTENPTYEDVCYRGTGHAEAVHVQYDPARIPLNTDRKSVV